MVNLDRVCCGVVHTDCDEFVVGACCICAAKNATRKRTTKNLIAREDK